MARTLDIALLDATLVAGINALHVAANKALAAAARGKQSAASLHAELVHCLHAGRNVGEALRVLGAGPASKHLLVAIYDATAEQVKEVVDLAAGNVTDPAAWYSSSSSSDSAATAAASTASASAAPAASASHVAVPALITLYRIAPAELALHAGSARAAVEEAVIHRIATQDLQN